MTFGMPIKSLSNRNFALFMTKDSQLDRFELITGVNADSRPNHHLSRFCTLSKIPFCMHCWRYKTQIKPRKIATKSAHIPCFRRLIRWEEWGKYGNVSSNENSQTISLRHRRIMLANVGQQMQYIHLISFPK